MVGLDIETGTLAGICVLSTLYGIYLVLFAASQYVLLFRYRRRDGQARSRPINMTLLIVSVVLFALITTHWIIQIVQLFDIFVFSVIEPYYNPKFIATNGLVIAECILADITMMYRLYLVWGRNWRPIIAPMITTTVAIISGVMTVVKMTQSVEVENLKVSHPWVLTLCSVELATNIVITVLITRPIWSNGRIKLSNHSRFLPIMSIIIESATIFTIFIIAILVTYLVNPILEDVIFSLSSPAIGIAFSLIIVRVGLGMAIEERTTPNLPNSYRSEGLSSNLLSLSVNISQDQAGRHTDSLVDTGGESAAGTNSNKTVLT